MLLPLSPLEIFLRLGAAFLAGAILGLERETHGRPAGLRTTIISCVAAAAASILAWDYAVEFKSSAPGAASTDPGRLVAGVLTGIGFLGAGTIMRQGIMVRGVTTAAVLWLSTILGLVLGAGQWMLGLGTLLCAVLALMGLSWLEDRVAHNSYAGIIITTQGDENLEQKLRQTVSQYVDIEKFTLEYDFNESRRTVRYAVKFPSNQAFELPSKVSEELRFVPGVIAVSWE